MISIVVAHSRNGVIGRQGALPWRLPSDLKRFRELTTGHAVVMGRKTFESLPAAYRPLPDRRNLVLSSRPDYRPEGCEVFPGLQPALEACAGDCFVIGGGVTYRDALPHTQRVYATEVDVEVADGDAFFDPLPGADWRCVERSEPLAENDCSFTFALYERSR